MQIPKIKNIRKISVTWKELMEGNSFNINMGPITL